MLSDDDDHIWHSLLSMGNQMTVIHKQSEIDDVQGGGEMRFAFFRIFRIFFRIFWAGPLV